MSGVEGEAAGLALLVPTGGAGVQRKQEQNQEQEYSVPDGLGLRCRVGGGTLHTQELPKVPGSQHLDKCCYTVDSYRPRPVLLQ